MIKGMDVGNSLLCFGDYQQLGQGEVKLGDRMWRLSEHGKKFRLYL